MKFLVFLAPLAFISFFMGIVYLISRAGWAKLAEVYPGNNFAGKTWKYRSCTIGTKSRYNGVVTFGANSDGLALSVSLFLFRPGHLPIFIPWSEITTQEKKRFLFSFTEFQSAKLPDLTIAVPKKMADLLLEFRHKNIAVLSAQTMSSKNENETLPLQKEASERLFKQSKKICSACGSKLNTYETVCICGKKV